MPSERRLEELVNTLEELSGVNDQSEDTPIVMRHTDVVSNRTVAIVCSQVEPRNMVLPLNVIWFCFKSESPLYKQALKRTSKDPGSFQSEDIQQSWDVLYFYEDIFENQVYDPDDLTLIQVSGTPFATVTQLGKVRLSQDPLDANLPVAIVDDDPRMFNDRDPLPHTHPERPARLLAHATGHSVVQNSVPSIGHVLLHNDTGGLVWRQLREEDLT